MNLEIFLKNMNFGIDNIKNQLKLWVKKNRLLLLRHRLHHQDIQVSVKYIYAGTLIGLLILVPSWVYFENGTYHWTVYLLSYSFSRLFFPIFLIWILRRNKLTWMQILVNHFGIILFSLLCALYVPTNLFDMRWIDRYDWFMVDAKIVLGIIVLAFTLNKLTK